MNEEITSLLNQLLTIGIKLLIAIVGIWLANIGIPWLKQQAIYSKIQKFVYAAEKKGESGAIDKSYKKTFVLNLLNYCGINVTEEIDAMIESAVEELDNLAAFALAQLAEDNSVTDAEDSGDAENADAAEI